MKKTSFLMTQLMLFVILLVAGSNERALAQSLEDGYYYITRTGSGLFLSDPEADDALAWRIKESPFEVNPAPIESDLPFIFKAMKQENGYYHFQNVRSKEFVGRITEPGHGHGAGLGLVAEPHDYELKYDIDGKDYTIQDMLDEQDHFYIMSWNDGYASYQFESGWYPADSRQWTFIKVDDAAVENPDNIAVTDKQLEDGYYIINLPKYGDGNVYMCATSDDNTDYRLSADIIDATDYDNAFIFHITKNEDNSYSIKNCGMQSDTYIEPYVFSPTDMTPVIMMTGKKGQKHQIDIYSNGDARIYTLGQDFNYKFNDATGNIVTSDMHGVSTQWKFIPVDNSRITGELKLQEAITEALGRHYEAGVNPGMVPEASLSAFEEVLTAAQNELKSVGTDHTATIGKLKQAVEQTDAQVVPFDDGYYRFVNRASGSYMTPVNKEYTWWLGHDIIDEYDPASYWHIYTTADGKKVMKSCGPMEKTYPFAQTEGNASSRTPMSGTMKSGYSFKQIRSNMYQVFCGNNVNPCVQSGGAYVTCDKGYSLESFWMLEKVAEEDLSPYVSIMETVTDAKGWVSDANVGVNPGQNKGDATELNKLIEAAETMYNEAMATEQEVADMLSKLRASIEAFKAQDHSMIEVTEGYYNIVSAEYFNADYGIEAMFTTTDNQLKWGVLNEKSPEFLFKLTDNGDGTFNIQNVQYKNYINTFGTKENTILMTNEPVAKYEFTYSGDETWKMAETGKSPLYLVTNGHEPAGTINLQDGDRAMWYMYKITDEVLLDSLFKVGEQNNITQQMRNALIIAEPAAKNVIRYNVDYNDGLIKEVDEENPLNGQIWASQEPAASPAGSEKYSSYANLIDGKTSTVFQSTWNPAVATPPQPFQVDLRNHPVQNFEYYMGLRDGYWGVKELWTDVSLYATNDPDIAAIPTVNPEDWTFVGRFTDLPRDFEYNGSNRGYYYRITDLDQPYRFLRFLVNSTYEPQANMMYCMGEFQMFDVQSDKVNSPYYYVEGLKELTDQLNALIKDAKAKIESNTVTLEEVDQILKITNEVKALTPDTKKLDAYIKNVIEYVGKFSFEDQWGDVTMEQYDEMMAAIDEAENYNHERPLVTELESKQAVLQTAFELFKSRQKTLESNRWYYISNTDITRKGNPNNIWDTFVYGNVLLAPATNNSRAAHWNGNTDACYWGYYNHSTEERDPDSYSDPYAMWRLVDITEEGATEKVYALQNRATGQYIERAISNGRFGMTFTPTPYKVDLLKSGQYALICAVPENVKNLPLHAAGDGYMTVYAGREDSPSSWNFEEVGSDIENMFVKIENNSMQIMTLPFAMDENTSSLNVDLGIRTYGIMGISKGGTELYLKNKTAIAAGEPFILVANDYTAPDPTLEKTLFAMPVANDFTAEATTVNGLVGVIDYTVPGVANYGIFVNSVLDSTTCETGIGGHSGYINPGLIVNETGTPDLTVAIGEGVLNAIDLPAITVDSEFVDVYTIDGVQIRKQVRRSNATDGLVPGIYIVDKQKVLVR